MHKRRLISIYQFETFVASAQYPVNNEMLSVLSSSNVAI